MLLTVEQRWCLCLPFELVGVLANMSGFALSAMHGLGGGRLRSFVVHDRSQSRRDQTLVAHIILVK